MKWKKRILSQTAPPEVTGLPNTIGEQNREEVTREVALLENREVQVLERESPCQRGTRNNSRLVTRDHNQVVQGAKHCKEVEDR